MNLIFDTHAHYDDEAFDADRDTLLASMPENGVGLIVDPGCDLESSRRAVALAEQYPHVYAAVGWHPENCAPYTRESLDTLRAWAKSPKVVAIGEIGLDYYWEQNPPREFQQEVFRAQLALAQELSLPVIARPRRARRQPCHREGISECARRVPLLFWQRRDRAGAYRARLVPRLRRPADLQKREKDRRSREDRPA